MDSDTVIICQYQWTDSDTVIICQYQWIDSDTVIICQYDSKTSLVWFFGSTH
jgi:nucleoid-associated protein YejK